MGVQYLKHSFPIVNYGYKVDDTLRRVITTIQSKSMKFEALLRLIPTIDADDMQEALLVPDYAPTRQVFWSLILSRLSIIKFILDIGKNSIVMNRSEINAFKRTLRELKMSHVFEASLSVNMLYDTMAIVDEILDI